MNNKTNNKTANIPTAKGIGNRNFSSLIVELEKMYSIINDCTSMPSINLPVYLTVQSKGKRNCFAWCTLKDVWQGSDSSAWEINFSAEDIGRDPSETFITMIHEMCHLMNIQEGTKDCSKSGRHNANFKAMCDRYHIICEPTEKIGYYTHFPMEKQDKLIQSLWAKYLEIANLKAFDKARESNPKVRTTKTVKMLKYVCPICGTIIRASKEVHVTCTDCGVEFGIPLD